ncbi:hypothetical protein PC9H_011678 [Pleurotus ostreatus]|uniref:Uncharacterized protein n=1 Tax=Pleurotus ostreatus TaxID=5322 RepID=A0A8H6ZLI5_PLEOS|nr:uncharacterized protein PC9H_011678 [Pleurotus ostreatus]KAF7421158.1 hypothetical protein PC9H_011678 [Pleurotus ostreatus]
MLRKELSPIFVSPESPTASGRMSSGSLIIDNADTQVHYSPGWKANGSPNEYKHTTSNTETQGASFTFNFVGTSVAVYGTLNDITFPNTTYVLDGGNPYPFFGQPAPLVQYQQIFYSSPVLPYGEHTLVGTCTDEGANVILDYLVVEMPLNSATNASSPTPTPTTAVPANPQPTSLTIAIVGGVLGGLLLLMTILALYLWYRQFQGRRSRTSFMSAEKGMKPRFLSADGGSSVYPVHQHRGGDDHDEDDVETPHHDVVVAVAVHKPPLPLWHQPVPPPSYAM